MSGNIISLDSDDDTQIEHSDPSPPKQAPGEVCLLSDDSNSGSETETETETVSGSDTDNRSFLAQIPRPPSGRQTRTPTPARAPAPALNQSFIALSPTPVTQRVLSIGQAPASQTPTPSPAPARLRRTREDITPSPEKHGIKRAKTETTVPRQENSPEPAINRTQDQQLPKPPPEAQQKSATAAKQTAASQIPPKVEPKQASSAAANFARMRAARVMQQHCPFPAVHGFFRRTWITGGPPNVAAPIEAVLRPQSLSMAVFSSFQWDIPWLFSKLKPGTKVRTILPEPLMETDHRGIENHEKFQLDEQQNIEMGRAQGADYGLSVSVTHASMDRAQNMHSKLMILKFDEGGPEGVPVPGTERRAKEWLRIVFPTANLVPYDWGGEVLENSFFLIDLPKLAAEEQADKGPAETTQFSTELFAYLRHLELEPSLVRSLGKYDFSRTRRIGFVHSLPGYSGRTGLLSLASAVNSIGLGLNKRSHLTRASARAPLVHARTGRRVLYASSSVGALDHCFLDQVYDALHGIDPANKCPLGKAPPPELRRALGLDTFAVYYPSTEYVDGSRGGRRGAGTICMQRRWWERPSFPSANFVEYRSGRKGVLSHNKIILVSDRPVSAVDNDVDGDDNGGGDTAGKTKTTATTATTTGPPTRQFMYVGSANLSESAWGCNRRGNCSPRNWECGVVFPSHLSYDELDRPGQAASAAAKRGFRLDGTTSVAEVNSGPDSEAATGKVQGADDLTLPFKLKTPSLRNPWVWDA